MTRSRAWRLFGLALTIAALWSAWRLVGGLDPLAVGLVLGHLQPAPYLAAGGAVALTIAVRALRWQRLINEDAGAHLARRMAFRLWLEGATLNALFPARAGDIYRIAATSAAAGTPWARAAGAAIIERILDLAALAISAAVAVRLAFDGALPPVLGGLILAIAALLTLTIPLILLPERLALPILARLSLPVSLRRPLVHLAAGAFGSVHARSLPMLTLTSFGGWLLEGLRLYLVVLALGDSLSPAAALLAALVAAFLTALPFTPAGLGFTEAGLLALLSLAFGLPAEIAAAIVLADRLLHTYIAIPFAALWRLAIHLPPLLRPAPVSDQPVS
jgi:uncharacterized protein (TIRG00374 family)